MIIFKLLCHSNKSGNPREATYPGHDTLRVPKLINPFLTRWNFSHTGNCIRRMSIDGSTSFIQQYISLVISGTCEKYALPIAHRHVKYKDNNQFLTVRFWSTAVIEFYAPTRHLSLDFTRTVQSIYPIISIISIFQSQIIDIIDYFSIAYRLYRLYQNK